MTANRNWGLITSGATFEALATTLIFFEDPQAALFGRRGKDGGQDARSGDGLRVYQAKHHEDGSAAKAIADAKREAAKIAEYHQPGHARHEQWKGVTHWRLVTNATFNPTDRQTWDDEVVPLFAKLGLIADYWERANLDGLLDKHPEVDRSYFQNETRALLTLPEVRERLPFEEPFLQRSPTTFVGRSSELAEVRTFLASDALFLVLHGPGGIGKTRLLVETGEDTARDGRWQVLWANVASMSSSGAWFEAVIPERPTLLLVDEPPDEELLRVLAEQLGGRTGRTGKWKVAVTVRSPKDPVLRFLRAPRMKARIQELEIRPLSTADADAMCFELLSGGALGSRPEEWRKDAAGTLAQRFSRHPVWLTLAVHVLEKHGDLTKVPETADDLAASYVDEIVALQSQSPPEQLLSLLRWIALIGTVNREDDAAVRLLAEGSGVADESAVRRMLASLVARRGLIQRGARDRLVELKPDVLRDHVLLRWLSVDIGFGDAPIQPSDEAKTLVTSVRDAVLGGSISSLGRAILTSLARTELILRLSGHAVPLLDPFFAGIHERLEAAGPAARVVIADVLLDVAPVRPLDTVRLSKALRSSVVATETVDGLFRSRDVGQDDVVLELAWPVFHAAMGATAAPDREAVLEELCVLAELEADIATREGRGLPNDGKRAAQLVGRALEGGPRFWADFEDATRAIAQRQLDAVAKEPATPARAAAMKALVKPAIALERRQTWSEDYTLHIATYVVAPGQPAWITRESLLKKIRALLSQDGVPAATRLVLWNLITEAHRSANRCRLQGTEEFRAQMRRENLDDLVWAQSVLEARSGELQELAAARDLWDWHHRFEKDPELKAASDRLEALYTGNDVAGEFEALLSRNAWEQAETRADAKATELAASETAADIEAFLERAVVFLGREHELYRVYGVALRLGSLAPSSDSVRSFVKGALAIPIPSPRTEFGVVAASGWVATLRKGDTPAAAHELVVELVAACGSDEQRISLVHRLYGLLPRPSNVCELSSAEHAYVRSLASLFLGKQRGPAFIQAVGWTIDHDWPGLKTLIARTLDDLPTDQVEAGIAALVDAVYWAVRERDPSTTPEGLGTWFLDQLLRLPDLDGLSGNLGWYVDEVLKHSGRVPFTWLPEALRTRSAMEAKSGPANFRAVASHARLSRYVTPLTEADLVNPAIALATATLVDLTSEKGTLGYYLPELLRDVDPHGHYVPGEIAKRLAGVTDKEDVWRLARVAGAYRLGDDAWRTIARPVIVRAAAGPNDEERRSLFGCLVDRGIRSWSGTPGEVPQLFIDEVESARRLLESETDAAYRPFWEWYVAGAEAELRSQEEHAREERGA